MVKRFLLVVVALAIATSALAGVRQTKQMTGVVNINTASQAELSMLPGVGKGKAAAIIAERQKGPFKAPQDIQKVKGIGKKQFASLEKFIVIDGQTTAKKVKKEAVKNSSNNI